MEKFIDLPKKQKSAKELRRYYESTPELERRLHVLVAMELRNFAMEQIAWARNEERSGLGLFEYADPYEGAQSLIEKLRIFGFLPEAADAGIEARAQGEAKAAERGEG